MEAELSVLAAGLEVSEARLALLATSEAMVEYATAERRGASADQLSGMRAALDARQLASKAEAQDAMRHIATAQQQTAEVVAARAAAAAATLQAAEA
eukprot:7380515-Prymnesium_polylepis.1